MKTYMKIPLDPSLRCMDAVEFEEELSKKIVGQPEAVQKTTKAIQRFMAGFHPGDRPIANILLLGPTGTGKTKLVESVCEVLFGGPKAMVVINCSEFQASHEVSKIIGAPPGYVGHGEDNAQITQEKLNKCHTAELKMSVLLLDEVEKAHANFWDMLLGVLDKGSLVNGKGKVIDLTRTLIYMTSNLGAREVMQSLQGGIGFHQGDQAIDKISQEAARKRFSPEFMNRLDYIITFNPLSEPTLLKILDNELGKIQKRITESPTTTQFVFVCSDDVKKFLIDEGVSSTYGARFLKRTIEKYLVDPLVNLSMTGQIERDDLIEISIVQTELEFTRIPSGAIETSSRRDWENFKSIGE